MSLLTKFNCYDGEKEFPFQAGAIGDFHIPSDDLPKPGTLVIMRKQIPGGIRRGTYEYKVVEVMSTEMEDARADHRALVKEYAKFTNTIHGEQIYFGKVHDLKCHSEFWKAVKHGSKNFEVRKDDRDFIAGDTLLLREYFPAEADLPFGASYSGDYGYFRVQYILRDPNYCKPGFCIMGIHKINFQ